MPGIISAVALTTALLSPPAAAPGAAAPAPISHSVRAIAARAAISPTLRASSIASARQQRDSLKNGAVTGAVIGGAAMLLFASRSCRETSCAPEVFLWTGVAAGLGAAVGAGIDALFSR